MLDPDGTLEALLERIAIALERSAGPRVPPPPHPSENWCEAITREGARCLKDAEADGFCKLHWRQKNR